PARTPNGKAAREANGARWHRARMRSNDSTCADKYAQAHHGQNRRLPSHSSVSGAKRHRITPRPTLNIMACNQVHALVNIRGAGIQLHRSVPVPGGLRVRRQRRVEAEASMESLTNHAVRVANVLTSVFGR